MLMRQKNILESSGVGRGSSSFLPADLMLSLETIFSLRTFFFLKLSVREEKDIEMQEDRRDESSYHERTLQECIAS